MRDQNGREALPLEKTQKVGGAVLIGTLFAGFIMMVLVLAFWG